MDNLASEMLELSPQIPEIFSMNFRGALPEDTLRRL
jgi:hypothetical protein